MTRPSRTRHGGATAAVVVALTALIGATVANPALSASRQHPCPSAGEAAAAERWPAAAEALSTCLKAADGEIERVTLTALRAAARRRAGDLEAAMADYTTLTDIDTDRLLAATAQDRRADLAGLLITAPRHAGDIERERGHDREALAHYLRFLELAPRHAAALPGEAARLGDLIADTGMRAATLAVALDEPDTCLRTLEPPRLAPETVSGGGTAPLADNRSYLALLSRCYLEADRVADGIAALDRLDRAHDDGGATTDAATSPALLLFRGMLHREAGDAEAARRDLRRAAEGAPEDPAPLVEIAILELRLGNTAQAMERTRAALSLEPEFPPALALRRHLESRRQDDAR